MAAIGWVDYAMWEDHHLNEVGSFVEQLTPYLVTLIGLLYGTNTVKSILGGKGGPPAQAQPQVPDK